MLVVTNPTQTSRINDTQPKQRSQAAISDRHIPIAVDKDGGKIKMANETALDGAARGDRAKRSSLSSQGYASDPDTKAKTASMNTRGTSKGVPTRSSTAPIARNKLPAADNTKRSKATTETPVSTEQRNEKKQPKGDGKTKPAPAQVRSPNRGPKGKVEGPELPPNESIAVKLFHEQHNLGDGTMSAIFTKPSEILKAENRKLSIKQAIQNVKIPEPKPELKKLPPELREKIKESKVKQQEQYKEKAATKKKQSEEEIFMTHLTHNKGAADKFAKPSDFKSLLNATKMKKQQIVAREADAQMRMQKIKDEIAGKPKTTSTEAQVATTEEEVEEFDYKALRKRVTDQMRTSFRQLMVQTKESTQMGVASTYPRACRRSSLVGTAGEVTPKARPSNRVPEMRRRGSARDLFIDDEDKIAQTEGSNVPIPKQTYPEISYLQLDSGVRMAKPGRKDQQMELREDVPNMSYLQFSDSANRTVSPLSKGSQNWKGREGVKGAGAVQDKALLEKRKKLDQAKIDFDRGYSLCWKDHDPGAALLEYRKTLFQRESLLGKYHEDTGRTYYWIGRSLVKLTDYDEALVAFGRAMRIFQRVLRTKHKYNKWVQHAIDNVFREREAAEGTKRDGGGRLTGMDVEHVFGDETDSENDESEHVEAGDDGQKKSQVEIKSHQLDEKTKMEQARKKPKQDDVVDDDENDDRWAEKDIVPEASKPTKGTGLHTDIPPETEYKRAILASIRHEQEGDAMRKRDQLSEAILQYRAAIDMIQEEYHPDAADLYCKIAIIMRQQGEFEHALEEYRYAAEIYELSLGADHPDTVKTLNQLMVKKRSGQMSMALMEKLHLDKSSLSKNQPNNNI